MSSSSLLERGEDLEFGRLGREVAEWTDRDAELFTISEECARRRAVFMARFISWRYGRKAVVAPTSPGEHWIDLPLRWADDGLPVNAGLTAIRRTDTVGMPGFNARPVMTRPLRGRIYRADQHERNDVERGHCRTCGRETLECPAGTEACRSCTEIAVDAAFGRMFLSSSGPV